MKRGGSLKRTSPLSPVSKKQAARLREYAKVKAEWWADPANHGCKAGILLSTVGIVGCTHKASPHPHHMRRRRGDMLCAKEWFLPVCDFCHNAIETHANIARQLGLLY